MMWRWINKVVRRWCYRRQLRDHRWWILRNCVIARDGNRCAECGSMDNLQVHHLRYLRGRKAWQYRLVDLMTLCRSCHARAHGRER